MSNFRFESNIKGNLTRVRRYGVSAETYEAMLQEQGFRCAICRTKEPGTRKGVAEDADWQWCVDHEHTSGRVRALLCMACNVGLGKFKDDPKIVRAAAQYLDQHLERNEIA